MFAGILANFNSIKVRLELSSDSPPMTGSRFQFHKGAIRTVNLPIVVNDYQLFQFHKGAIRTGREAHRRGGLQEFQFHKGAIRTLLLCFLLLIMK